MIPPRPEVIRDDARFAVSELEKDLGGALPAEQRERLLFDLSRHHRLAAIGALLSEADVEEWRRELIASASTRRALLLLPGRAGRASSPYQCASAIGPLFDALAAGDGELAREIAGLSPSEWMEDDEYEDDFWYARFLHAFLVARLASSPEVDAALASLERSSSDGSPRLAVARALSNRDQDGFDAAMEALLADRETELAKLEDEILLDPSRHEAEKHVYVEGIALVHLAEAVGLATLPEYRMVPALARRDALT